jgi:uncharacterized protein (DUF433 family)
MNEDREYVRKDENGVFRVGDTRVMLDSVIAAFHDGHSPETILQQYPSLTLEEVYGAITYCLAHADEVKQYLEGQDEVWEEWRQKTKGKPGSVVARLRALRKMELTEVT